MEIRWRLRIAAAQREVWTGAQLRRLLAERAGLESPLASVSHCSPSSPASAPGELSLQRLQTGQMEASRLKCV